MYKQYDNIHTYKHMYKVNITVRQQTVSNSAGQRSNESGIILTNDVKLLELIIC